jgi:trigger factor
LFLLKATVKEPASWKRLIDVEIPHETVADAFEKKLHKYKSQAKMPGFRTGKVPEAMVRQRYGGSIKAEIIEDLIQKSFESACREHDIMPITQAKINNLKADDGQPLSFTIETEVDPKVEIKGYEKLKIKVSQNKIKPAQVDDVVKDLRERVATFTDVDRASKKGDFVSIEYMKVIVDGTERKDISSPKYPIEVGASKIKEFDKALLGKNVNEVVDLDFKFPKDYADAEIAGKPAEFTVQVKKVQERAIPEVNEEFLKKMGDFKDEEALRANIQKDLEARELDRARNEAYNEAIEKLVKDNPFEVPPSRVEAYIDYTVEEAKKYAQAGQPQPSREEMATRYRDMGVRTLKRYTIINFIANKEGIKPTQDEVDEQIKKIAERYNQEFDKVKQALRQNGTVNRIREDIREQHTLNFLIGEYTPPALPAAAAPAETGADATVE